MQNLTVFKLEQYLNHQFPSSLAEEWDNVGLLIGDRKNHIQKVLCCLTLTQEVVEEAIELNISLIVTHHPLPFKPTKKILADDLVGGLLIKLIENKIAVYSPHTAYDSAENGINQQLAEILDLEDINPLMPMENSLYGAGRYGRLRMPQQLAGISKTLTNITKSTETNFSGNAKRPIEKIAIACGAAGHFLSYAYEKKCDLFITGEANFHTCLEAKALGMGILLLGRYASERFAVERLAEQIRDQFPELLHCAASKTEQNPIYKI